MVSRALPVLVVLLVAGCDGDLASAPPALAALEEPHVLFMVRNEVFGIRLDGTGRRSYGVVGDDRRRAGYPRLLPDGRISVIADQVGRVYPFTSAGDRGYRRVGFESVWIGDGACGTTVHDRPSLIYFATSVYTDGTISSTALRASTDGRSVEGFGVLDRGGLFGPHPDGADHILVVRTPLEGDDEIWRLDASGDQAALDHPEVIARVAFPFVARSPGRLTDGRVVYVRFDMRDHNRYGELRVVGIDGDDRATGIYGVDDATVFGNQVVCEARGGAGLSDLVLTNLRDPPTNITFTPYIAEHLGWGAPEPPAQ